MSKQDAFVCFVPIKVDKAVWHCPGSVRYCKGSSPRTEGRGARYASGHRTRVGRGSATRHAFISVFMRQRSL